MVNGSHAYARRARFQPQFCFFAVTSVTHEEKKRKREEEFCKTEVWNTRFSMSFPLVYAYSTHSFVKTV